MIGSARLFEISFALALDEPIDRDMRADLREIVRYYAKRHGGKRAHELARERVGVVGVLVEHHGIEPKAATIAAWPTATPTQLESLARSYRNARNRGANITVAARLVNAALARVKARKRKTGGS